MYTFGLVNEDHESRWADGGLSHVEEFQALAAIHRRLVVILGIFQNFIQCRGSHFTVELVIHHLNISHDLVDALTGQSGNKVNRAVRQETKSRTHILDVLAHGFVVFLEQIPLIDHDDNGPATLVGIAGNRQVLIGNTFLSIDHDQSDVTAVQGFESLDHRVLFKLLRDSAFAPDAGCIDQHIAPIIIGKSCINAVAGRSRRRVGDHAFIAEQTINERRFSDIRPTDDRHAGFSLFIVVIILLRHQGKKLLNQVIRANAMLCGNRVNRINPQSIELTQVSLLSWTIHLVDDKKNRLIHLAQHMRNLFISWVQAFTTIHQEDDDVGLFDSQLRLLAHLRKQTLTADRLKTTCIDQSKTFLKAIDIRIIAVAGHPR